MSSKTKKQAKFMSGCAHGMKSPNCPPKQTAEEYFREDQAKESRRKRLAAKRRDKYE
jgi:hypothetical protein